MCKNKPGGCLARMEKEFFILNSSFFIKKRFFILHSSFFIKKRGVCKNKPGGCLTRMVEEYCGIFNCWKKTIQMKDEIRKELQRLIITVLEAGLVYKYYTKQVTSMLEAQNASMKALMESAKVADLTDEEREQLSFKLRQSELEGNACREITTHIQCLADKAFRKVNETEQILKAFCKRHNIENVDEYLKDLKR